MEDLSKRWFHRLGRLGDWNCHFFRHFSQCACAYRCDYCGADRYLLPFMKEKKFSVWLRLLWMFLKVNILSPSGPASVGFLYEEAVGKIMTEEQFVEAVGFSNVLPGSEAL